MLLLEHHYQFGGLATWFTRRGGHIFDISLHGFPVGMIKSCRKYWTKEIADSIVQLKDVRFVNPQMDVWTTFTRDDYTRVLIEQFHLEDVCHRPTRELAYGKRRLLEMAIALATAPRLLLLDEPTNHLDLDALVWLEGWLQRHPATLLIISHDREFLDAVTRVTLHPGAAVVERVAKVSAGSRELLLGCLPEGFDPARVRYDEVASGHIGHAITITLPNIRSGAAV
mgnify:CR=1 FL=1